MLIMYLVPAAIGSHQDEELANEEGKNTHLIGAQCAQNSATDPELTFLTSGNEYSGKPIC